MNRLSLAFCMITLAAPLSGCGSQAVPATDKSDLPSEVREAEEKMEAEAAKKEAELQKRLNKGR